MSFIRGKIESPREIVQKEITIGESPFRKCKCGCNKWFDKKTGKQCKVTTMSELFKDLDKPLCGNKK